jgi:hypothetical protein
MTIAADRLFAKRARITALGVWVLHLVSALVVCFLVFSVGQGALSQKGLVDAVIKVFGFFSPQLAIIYAFLFHVNSGKPTASSPDRTTITVALILIVLCHCLVLSLFAYQALELCRALKSATSPATSFSDVIDFYISYGGIAFTVFAAAPLTYLYPRPS